MNLLEHFHGASGKRAPKVYTLEQIDDALPGLEDKLEAARGAAKAATSAQAERFAAHTLGEQPSTKAELDEAQREVERTAGEVAAYSASIEELQRQRTDRLGEQERASGRELLRMVKEEAAVLERLSDEYEAHAPVIAKTLAAMNASAARLSKLAAGDEMRACCPTLLTRTKTLTERRPGEIPLSVEARNVAAVAVRTVGAA